MSVDSGFPGQTATLPVVATIRAAYATVFGGLGDLVALAAVPFAISLAGQILILFVPVGLFFGLAEKTGAGGYFALTLMIGFLTTFVPWTVFFVAWHRFVLLGKRDTDRPVEFYFGTRNVKYYFGTREGNIFGNNFFMTMFLPGTLIVFSVITLLLLSSSVSSYSNTSRMELITLGSFSFIISLGPFLSLPAHAIGHETSVYTAYRQIRGVVWRFFWTMFLVATPFLFLFGQLKMPGPLAMAGYDAESRQYIFAAYILLTIAEGLVLFVGTALFVAALCISYQRVVGESARKANPEDAAGPTDWVIHFMLPIVLALILALVVYAIAAALNVPPKGQFLLAAVAGLGSLIWKIHRLQPREPGSG